VLLMSCYFYECLLQFLSGRLTVLNDVIDNDEIRNMLEIRIIKYRLVN